MEQQRLFSLEEANELLPRLNAAFERLERLRNEISIAYRALREAGVSIEDEDAIEALDPSSLDASLRSDAARLKQMVREVGRTLTALHEEGCIIKDLRLGLVDFYSLIDGMPVFLCWQFGEQAIAFYHPVDQGFSSRIALPNRQTLGLMYN